MNWTWEQLMESWPLLVSGAAIIIWGIRLEGLVRMNRNDLNHLEERMERQDTELKERLAKIDGRLETIASSLERVIWRIPRQNNNDNRE